MWTLSTTVIEQVSRRCCSDMLLGNGSMAIESTLGLSNCRHKRPEFRSKIEASGRVSEFCLICFESFSLLRRAWSHRDYCFQSFPEWNVGPLQMGRIRGRTREPVWCLQLPPDKTRACTRRFHCFTCPIAIGRMSPFVQVGCAEPTSAMQIRSPTASGERYLKNSDRHLINHARTLLIESQPNRGKIA